MKKIIVTTFLLTANITFSGESSSKVYPNGYTISGSAAKEIIENFPWENPTIVKVKHGDTIEDKLSHTITKYKFEKKYGLPIISCLKNSQILHKEGTSYIQHSCRIFAEIYREADDAVEFYSPDYSWCSKNSFFYQLANYNPEEPNNPCYTSFDYEAVSGVTHGHWFGSIKIKISDEN